MSSRENEVTESLVIVRQFVTIMASAVPPTNDPTYCCNLLKFVFSRDCFTRLGGEKGRGGVTFQMDR